MRIEVWETRMCWTPRYIVDWFLGNVVGLVGGEAVLGVFVGVFVGQRGRY